MGKLEVGFDENEKRSRNINGVGKDTVNYNGYVPCDVEKSWTVMFERTEHIRYNLYKISLFSSIYSELLVRMCSNVNDLTAYRTTLSEGPHEAASYLQGSLIQLARHQ